MVSSPGQTSFVPTLIILHKLPFKFRVHATLVVCRCVKQPKWFTVKSPKCHLAKSLVAWNSELFCPKFHNAKKDPTNPKWKIHPKFGLWFDIMETVWLGLTNEDQQGCCPRRLQALSWLSRPSGTGRSSCSVGTCRSGLGFRWWKYPPELSSSVVFLWGSLSGSLQTVKQPCGVCGAGRLYQQPCQTTGGSLCATLRLFEAVFVVFLRCPSVTMASGEFATQDHLGQTVVLYSGYVTSPSELLLQ